MNQKKGAEAIIFESKLIGIPVLEKRRIEKKYRVKELDIKIRKERTRKEARLLHAAKLCGVKTPTVFYVTDFSLFLSKEKGNRLTPSEEKVLKCGRILRTLHDNDIIHGDFTPANILENGDELIVIDFGLGFFSNSLEDKAIEVFTFLKSIPSSFHQSFWKGYTPSAQMLKKLEEIKSRMRYA